MKSMEVIAGRYQVVKGPTEDRTLQGGFGAVYLCADQQDEGRPVALKTFRAQFLSDREKRGRFLREAEIWLRLGRHPHIVRAHKVLGHTIGQQIYIVMDWVAAAEGKNGASLREWLRPGRPLAAARALGWGLQIVRAMQHATLTVPGLVHRDLKPENVLVGRDENARVTDFGLARMMTDADLPVLQTHDNKDNDERLARHASVTAGVGTLAYMAPEQFESGHLDLRADIYALGCLLLEILIGETAVQTRLGPNAYRELHQRGLAGRRTERLPSDLSQWLRRCLAVSPDERHQSWEEVEASLISLSTRVTGRVPPALTISNHETRDDRIAAGWSLNAIGSSYGDIGQVNVSAQCFERARRVGEAERDRILEMMSLRNLAIVRRMLGELPTAMESLEHFLIVSRELADCTYECMALIDLGAAYLDLKDARRAIGYFEEAFAIARANKDRVGEQHAQGALGNAVRELGESRKAIDYYLQALAIALEIGDRVSEGRLLTNMAATHIDIGERQPANDYLNRALLIARETANLSLERTCHYNLGRSHHALGGTPRAIEHFEQALVIARGLGDRRSERAALHKLGGTYQELGEIERAIDCYKQVLTIAEELGDRPGQAIVLNDLGLARHAHGEMRQAVDDFERARSIAWENGNWRTARTALLHLAKVYYEAGEVERVIPYYDETLSIAISMLDREQEALAMGRLARAYEAIGNVGMAINYYEGELAICRELDDRKGEANASLNLAFISHNLRVPRNARERAEVASRLFRELGESAQAQRADDLLRRLEDAEVPPRSGPKEEP